MLVKLVTVSLAFGLEPIEEDDAYCSLSNAITSLGADICSENDTLKQCCLNLTERNLSTKCMFPTRIATEFAMGCCNMDGVYCGSRKCELYNAPICCPTGEDGKIFPCTGPAENEWNASGVQEFRGFIYFIFLIWFFMGVTAAADIFMAGVEVITSTQTSVQVIVNGEKQEVEVQSWNDTVANLTLMALGSSAPEILLSIIELLSDGFYSGALGPSTIVGSASFNLFIISAICISSIPEPEVRYIKDVDVFVITAFFSLFAYFWILVIVDFVSKDVIELWEAILTLFFTVILIVLAYLADVGKLSFGLNASEKIAPEEEDLENADRAEAQYRLEESKEADQAKDKEIDAKEEMYMKRKQTLKAKIVDRLEQNPDANVDDIVGEMQKEMKEQDDQTFSIYCNAAGKKMSRAVYRQAACQGLVRSKTAMIGDTMALVKESLSSVMDETKEKALEKTTDKMVKATTFQFPVAHYSVIESEGKVTCKIQRTGDMSQYVKVPYFTIEDSAKAHDDFLPVNSFLIFKPGEAEKDVEILIVDDDINEPDEHFYCSLGAPSFVDSDGKDKVPDDPDLVARLGLKKLARITIIDDDEPGVIEFESQEMIATGDGRKMIIRIKRGQESSARVSCKYEALQQSAKPGVDFKDARGELEFLPGEFNKQIQIDIIESGNTKPKTFKVVLKNPAGGVKFGLPDGSQNTVELENVITVMPDQSERDMMARMVTNLSGWLSVEDELPEWQENWRNQFVEAFWVGGSREAQAEAGIIDWIWHILNFPFGLLIACAPPTDILGGWACFIVSLLFIAAFTALINDLASLLGCCVNLPDDVTAITIVALGTSLPDMFASKMAARSDPHADASIGNITGSNSVNVFLGLGISWTMGAVYWGAQPKQGPGTNWYKRYNGYISEDLLMSGGFIVRGGSLKMNVLIFLVGAVLTFTLFSWRRKTFGGELGGPKKYANMSSAILIFIWITYVIVASHFALVEELKESQIRL